MLNIVIDTNVLISAIGWENGNEREIVDKCADKVFQLIESHDLLDEFERVIFYKKFDFIPDYKKKEFLGTLSEISRIIRPTRKLDIIKADKTDNKILECALEGKVDYIISGDKHLLDLKEFSGMKIVKPAEFLKILHK